MKPTHLKTLSARVDELEELRILSDLSYLEFTRLVLDANKQSKTIVTLAHFVPCDKNSVPLKYPTMQDIRLENNLLIPWDQLYHDRTKAYNEAQKSVIFEGWEVVSDDTYNSGYRIITLVSKENSASLDFYYDTSCNNNCTDICVTFPHGGEQLPKEPTLADLAAATTENPLKLK